MDAVEKNKGEDWAAISELVSGRTKIHCKNRWDNMLHSQSNDSTTRLGVWTTEEDSTLTDAVVRHKDEGWAAISELVSGRTKTQCTHRWHNALHAESDETSARAAKWTTDEDSTLTDAVEKHKGEDWAIISELVPGRTKILCNNRWVKCLDFGPKSHHNH
jgi:hypothetical protein